MSRSLMFVLVIVMLLAAAVVPVAAYTSPCDSGSVWFQPDKGKDEAPNNGTEKRPFMTTLKSRIVAWATGWMRIRVRC